MSDHPKCEACGVPLTEHRGLFATCGLLLIAEKRIEALVAELRRLQAVVCEQDSESIDAVIGDDEATN